MITRTTRRALIAAVGATVSAAAATVAVTPTASYADPTPAAPQLTASQIAAFKAFVDKSRAAAAGSATSSATASPNATTFPGDCDTPTRLDLGGGLAALIPTLGGNTLFCTLRNGDNNLAVGKLQLALNDCYGQGLATDNDFGGNTQGAVVNVQRAKNLPNLSGVYDTTLINAGFQYPIVNSNNSYIHECIDNNMNVYDH
jgi:peptidoglycan hydrolase-like protein with peptidoglycan-binding domain